MMPFYRSAVCSVMLFASYRCNAAWPLSPTQLFVVSHSSKIRKIVPFLLHFDQNHSENTNFFTEVLATRKHR
jgi:hypothetical protein